MKALISVSDKTGIVEFAKELENLGITDGDTVYVYGHAFEYYK